MTTTEFQQRFPKPWRLIMFKSNFSLRAANHEIIATLGVSSFHTGIPQNEWNRHMVAALKEYIPVVEPDATTDTRSAFHRQPKRD